MLTLSATPRRIDPNALASPRSLGATVAGLGSGFPGPQPHWAWSSRRASARRLVGGFGPLIVIFGLIFGLQSPAIAERSTTTVPAWSAPVSEGEVERLEADGQTWLVAKGYPALTEQRAIDDAMNRLERVIADRLWQDTDTEPTDWQP